jgi:hypothetical protein
MKLLTIIFSVFAAATSAQAASIAHDQVQPLPEPEPQTASEETAVTFKPQLFIHSGCHPYPAVNADGDTSAGLKGTGASDGDCTGSSLGSQVYERSVSYNDRWAFMYAWYFPKDKAYTFKKGHRHEWLNVVVWLDDPELERPSILGISTWNYDGQYVNNAPTARYSLSPYINGTHALVASLSVPLSSIGHVLETTAFALEFEVGEFQDLITWEQLPDVAQTALQDADFGDDVKVPFIDDNFEENLKNAWPF